MPEAAICVQDIDVQCVLQFTLIHAAGCALHRHTSRVIHRQELSCFYLLSFREQRRARPEASDRAPLSFEPLHLSYHNDDVKRECLRGVRPGDRRRFFKPRQIRPASKGTRILRLRTLCNCGYVSTTIYDASPRRSVASRGFTRNSNRSDDIERHFTQVKCNFSHFTLMILPQVHLRKPCYDFYFL